MNPARIKIPQDIDGEFPIIFSPNQPLKVPIMGKIPHFSQHWIILSNVGQNPAESLVFRSLSAFREDTELDE